MTPENVVLSGDCLDVMATFDAESIDAIVTDPPYGLEFMGKGWDKLDGPGFRKPSARDRQPGSAHNSSTSLVARNLPEAYVAGKRMQEWHEAWAREAFRVAKPGAHLLAFGGTRTYHRLAAAIEDAGWEIRDTLVWAYASGFPKSRNLDGEWQGWGTALKPAWEPIVMARKPLRGTVAGNVLAHGTGALNIDGTRIGNTQEDRDWIERTARPNTRGDRHEGAVMNRPAEPAVNVSPLGRWPSNLLLTDPIFDGDVPGVVGGGDNPGGIRPALLAGRAQSGRVTAYGEGVGAKDEGELYVGYGDSGTYSRFFLIPKAARRDREPQGHRGEDRLNTHPTVKPSRLMRHLVRLVTPPGGIVLDPFLGSGTTALAAEAEGFRWVGIEREPEYVAIAEARLDGTHRGLGLTG